MLIRTVRKRGREGQCQQEENNGQRTEEVGLSGNSKRPTLPVISHKLKILRQGRKYAEVKLFLLHAC